MNRVNFQVKYAVLAQQPFLNIGSSDDPLHFNKAAIHVDIDDYSSTLPNFVQADICLGLPFDDRQFQTVIMGDIVEHLYDPKAGILNCARVCSDILVMTIFEETRIDVGQHIDQARKLSSNSKLDVGLPHLLHINHFTEYDINGFIRMLKDFTVLEKLYEHEVIGLYEWLIALKRIK